MSRGGSYGGGKSSLSYLFEQDETSTKHAQKVQAKVHEKSEEANRTRVFMSKPAGEKLQTTENTNTKLAQEGKPQKHISSDGAGRKYQDQSAVHFHTGVRRQRLIQFREGNPPLGISLETSDLSFR